MDTRILVFSQDRAATLELFNQTLIKKHARVASIERMRSQLEPPDLGLYGYNFFGTPVGRDPVILNSVWHFGDTVNTLDSLFTDLTTFRRHHLESHSSWKQIHFFVTSPFFIPHVQLAGALPWAQYVRATVVPDEAGGNATHRCVEYVSNVYLVRWVIIGYATQVQGLLGIWD